MVRTLRRLEEGKAHPKEVIGISRDSMVLFVVSLSETLQWILLQTGGRNHCIEFPGPCSFSSQRQLEMMIRNMHPLREIEAMRPVAVRS